MRFKEKFYTAPNMVFAISGNFDRDKVVELVSKAAAPLKPGLKNTFAAASIRGGEAIEGRPIKQVNIALGCEGAARGTKEALAENLYAHILGGGMSSRLFKEIREKRGLVYSIYAGAQAHDGVGEFGIGAGLAGKDVPEFMKAVTEEIKKSRGTITQAELDEALISLKNSLYGGLESIGSRAKTMGTNFLNGRTLDYQAAYNKFAAITLDDVNEASKRVFTKGLSLAAVGPQDKLPTLAEFTKDLA